MINYHEYKAVNFLKNYIHSFIYLKTRECDRSVSFYPDGSDYLVYNETNLYIISKNSLKQQLTFFLDQEVEYFIVRLKCFSLYFFKQNEEHYTQTFQVVKKMFKKAKTFGEKKKLMELFIIELTNAEALNNKIVNACNKIVEAKGDITCKNLALQCNVQLRTLQRDFKKVTQLSPKEFINLIRFQNTISTLYTKINRFKIVKIDPYYDYSHFYKTFKKYLSLSPNEFKIGKGVHIKSLFDL